MKITQQENSSRVIVISINIFQPYLIYNFSFLLNTNQSHVWLLYITWKRTCRLWTMVIDNYVVYIKLKNVSCYDGALQHDQKLPAWYNLRWLRRNKQTYLVMNKKELYVTAIKHPALLITKTRLCLTLAWGILRTFDVLEVRRLDFWLFVVLAKRIMLDYLPLPHSSLTR